MSDLTTDELADLWHTYTRWEEGDDFGEHMASAVERIVAARAEAAEAKVAAVEAAIRESIAQPHTRASTDAGPDYCSTCSEAVQEWVTWPCPATQPARAEAEAKVAAVEALADEWQARAATCERAGHGPWAMWQHRARDLRAALGESRP